MSTTEPDSGGPSHTEEWARGRTGTTSPLLRHERGLPESSRVTFFLIPKSSLVAFHFPPRRSFTPFPYVPLRKRTCSFRHRRKPKFHENDKIERNGLSCDFPSPSATSYPRKVGDGFGKSPDPGSHEDRTGQDVNEGRYSGDVLS